MDLVCRLCGSATSELVQRFNEGSKHWTILVAKVRCDVQFDRDPSLPQMVCISCVTTHKEFDKYCKTVKDNQKYLKKALKTTVMKPEKVSEAPCITVSPAIDNISLPSIDISVKFETSEHDYAGDHRPLRLRSESNDSVNEHKYKLRKKKISREREFSRERQPSNYPEAYAKFTIDIVGMKIDYVETDPESERESDECESDDDKLKDFVGRTMKPRKKRSLEPSSDFNLSPEKRLKLEMAERHAVVRKYKIKFTPKPQ